MSDKHEKDRAFLDSLRTGETAALEQRLVQAMQQKKYPPWRLVALQRAVKARWRQKASFDLAERAREKQASRDEDARTLAAGEKTREQLAEENGAFSFPRERMRIVEFK